MDAELLLAAGSLFLGGGPKCNNERYKFKKNKIENNTKNKGVILLLLRNKKTNDMVKTPETTGKIFNKKKSIYSIQQIY